jgi:hypothetical protein
MGCQIMEFDMLSSVVYEKLKYLPYAFFILALFAIYEFSLFSAFWMIALGVISYYGLKFLKPNGGGIGPY